MDDEQREQYEKEQKEQEGNVVMEMWEFFDWVSKNHPEIYHEYQRARGREA